MLVLSAGWPLAFARAQAPEQQPVDLTADTLEHDETGQIITATGRVELIQEGRILRADRVTYNLGTDTVRAQGNVVLSEPTGDTYFAEEFELTDKMKNGFVTGLRGLLADGSRFAAVQGERIAGTTLVMREASYTPCEPCKNDPTRPPVWQLVADKVTHHADEQRISYEDARLEMFGVPVLYTPYFSHPDGTVEQKSGFLTPRFGFDSTLGANYHQEYYWAIAPDKDATVGLMAATEENPLLTAEYRQRFENAHVEIAGGITYSGRSDSQAGVTVEHENEARGHLFTDAGWDINEKWRAGLKTELTTDDQYLRQYDISSEDVLENEIYAERFSGRDYAVGRMLAFQDIRVSNRRADQPAVLPEIIASFVGEPNAALGGRWDAKVSMLGLEREGDDQDMTRGSLDLGWERRFVSDFGLVSTVTTLARGDLYNTRDRDLATPGSGRSSEASEARGFVQGHAQSSYPLVKPFDSMQMVVEPIAAVTVGSNVDVNSDVPNEDSQDVFIDAPKLFEPNRFPGYDRIEDRAHVTYGVRSGLHGHNGYRGEVFFGHSHRFDNNDNPFPEGSGLSGQESDYVGQVTADLGRYLNLDYRFQLENTSLSSQRHEVDAVTNLGPVTFGTRYFYTGALQGTDLTRSREQIRTAARYRLTDQWHLHGSMRYDLGKDEGLRSATYGIDWLGQCMLFSVTGQRTLTRDAVGDSNTEIMFRIGLKNLGEFATSGLSVGGSDE